MGLVGCNLKCSFCQNYEISQASPEDLDSYDAAPADLVKKARESGCLGIAFTYNEPTVSIEYSLDTFELARKEGLYTCYVTNGYINPDPAREIGRYLSCANVDLKSSETEFYRKLCKAPKIEAVKDAIRIWNEMGVAVEITTLVIPGHNDSPKAIGGVIEFVRELAPDIPLHFSRFHPMYMLTDVEPTPTETIDRAVQAARARGLKYVYAGNVFGSRWENTYCPNCGNVVIERHGYVLGRIALDSANRCKNCGQPVKILGKPVRQRPFAFF